MLKGIIIHLGVRTEDWAWLPSGRGWSRANTSSQSLGESQPLRLQVLLGLSWATQLHSGNRTTLILSVPPSQVQESKQRSAAVPHPTPPLPSLPLKHDTKRVKARYTVGVSALLFPGVKQPYWFWKIRSQPLQRQCWSQSWAGASKLPICPSRSSGDIQRTCTEDQLPKQTDQGFLETQREDRAWGEGLQVGGMGGDRWERKRKHVALAGGKVSRILRI